MLFDDVNAPPAAPLSIKPAEIIPAVPVTPLFGLPLLGAAGPECGGCTRFVPLAGAGRIAKGDSLVTGRCKLGIKPGVINRRTPACNIHRARGIPKRFLKRAVRP